MRKYFLTGWILLLLSLCGVAISPAHAQSLYNHPEVKWNSFETENFIIYYADGLSNIANLAAKIAEEIHEPLCELYDYRPDTKVSLIFQDNDDIANASSYFMNNKISFWSTAMAWELRGTHHWLRNVVTHEYTHMIQLGASRKWSRRFPAAYIQWMGYEPERRPDVLYGFPNRVASYPYPAVTIPGWFAEGTAQFQFTGDGYDFWDSHRDMLLRMAVLSDNLLSLEEMGYFGKTSLGSEMVYNQGFSLTKYISDNSGGPEVLEKISDAMQAPYPITLSRALKKTTGKSGRAWYRAWKAQLEQEYTAVQNAIAPTVVPTDTIPTEGFVNLFPRLSPDGKKITFISNQGRDYWSQSNLCLYDIESDEVEIVAGSVQGATCWLPDTSGILFSRRLRSPRTGSLQYDVFVYLVEKKKSIRLTRGLRAEGVDLSSDGRTLALTVNEAGHRDLALMPMPENFTSKKFKPLTMDDVIYRHRGGDLFQYYYPRWSPDGSQLVAASSLNEGRNIEIFRVSPERDSLWLKETISGQNMEMRDPSFCEDGQHIVAAYDESGISNIYRINLENGNREQLTSVIGGAYYPDLRDGKLTFCDFTGEGFKVCLVQNPEPIKIPPSHLDEETYASKVPAPTYDNHYTIAEASSYKPRFDNLYWYPRVMVDYETVKLGSYVWLGDILDKLNFFGGFAINKNQDFDLYGQVEYRVFHPTIFAEVFSIQRRLTQHFDDPQVIIGEKDGVPIFDRYRIRYRYDLAEIDGGLKWPLSRSSHLKLMGVYDRYTAHNRFDDGTAIALNYFKGWSAQLGYFTNKVAPGIDSRVNPSRGYYGFLKYTRANQKFFTGFRIDADKFILVEVYEPYNYNLLEAGFEKYFPLPIGSHAFALRFQGGYIDKTVDPFFHIYGGGLPGMRGYSFYSLGGERTAVATATYRFPIVKQVDWSLFPVSINRIYGNLFCDVGDAWVGDLETDQVKKDVGAGLRIQMHSFYMYPTALAFDVAYGFDRFTHVEEDFEATYGKEFRYYLTVLFDFYTPFLSNH